MSGDAATLAPAVFDGAQPEWAAPEAQPNRAARRSAAKADKSWLPALATLLAALPVLNADGAAKNADGEKPKELVLTPGALAAHLAALLLWVERGERDITAAEVAAATGRDRRGVRKCFAAQLGPVGLWEVTKGRQRMRPTASYAKMTAGARGIYGKVPVRLVRKLCRGAADDKDKVRRRFAALRLAVHLAVEDFRHGNIPHTHRHLGDDISRRTRAAGAAARLLRRLGLVKTEPAVEEIDGLHYQLVY